MKKHFLTLVLLSLFSSLFAEDVKSNFMSESWSQTFPYNNLVPAYLPAGSEDGEFQEKWKGHVVAGCVATAMAQTMHYWQWPRQFDASTNISHTVNIDKGKYQFGVEHTIVRGVPLAYDDTPESKARVTFIAATLGELAFDRDGTGGRPEDVAGKLGSYYVVPPTCDNQDLRNYLKLGYPVPATISSHAIVLTGWKQDEKGVEWYWKNNGEAGGGDGWIPRSDIKSLHPCFPKKMAMVAPVPDKVQLPLTISWSFPDRYSKIYPEAFEGFTLDATPSSSKGTPEISLSLGPDVRSYEFEKLTNNETYIFEITPRFKDLEDGDPTVFIKPEKTSVTTTIDASAPAAPTLTAPKTFAASLTGCSFKLTGSETISSLALTTSLKSYTLGKTTYNLSDYVSIVGEKGDYTVKIKPIDFLKNSDNYNVVFTFAGDDNNGATAYAETIVNFSATNKGENSGTDPEEGEGQGGEVEAEYILISPKNFVGYWQEYIAARKAAHPDMTFAVKDAAEIYAEYKDLTPAEKIKEYIASRVKGGTKYIVLGGAWSNITTDDGKSEESFILPGDNGDKYKPEALSLDNTIPGFTDDFKFSADLTKSLAFDYEYALIDSDFKPDVVVARIPLIPWPRTDGTVPTFEEMIKGYGRKVAKAEDSKFSGAHRYACAGAGLCDNPTVNRGDVLWPTERHRYCDGYYDFFDPRHPASVADGIIAARRRFRDFFAKYNPVKGAMVIPMEDNTADKFFADENGWEAIIAKTHGWAYESWGTGLNDARFREAKNLVKFGVFAMPCLTGKPDRTTTWNGWTNLYCPSMGAAAICNPDGGEVVGFHNTHDAPGEKNLTKVTNNTDPYATQYETCLLAALFEQHLSAGDAWKAAHEAFIDKQGTGITNKWMAYESILYGDPLVAPSVVNEPVCGEGAVPARVLFK